MALTIRVRPKFPARVLGSDGISIAKVGGTYTFSLDADLTAVAAVSGTGIVRRISSSSWTAGTAVSLAEMAQRSASILIGNPTGAPAVPSEITLNQSLDFSGTTLRATGLPISDDGAALGSGGTRWSDLFLAPGGVINFAASDVTLSHATNALAFGGASSGYTFDNLLIVGTGSAISVGGLTSNIELFGTTPATASLAIGLFDATASDAPGVNFYRSKNAAISSATVVASGDELGKITWYGAQQTGTLATQNPAAQIRALVDGTVTSGAGGDMPGRLVFSTTPDASGTLTDRLILDSAGIFKPNANDGVALGTAALGFSDAFFATGAVIGFGNSNFDITHAAGSLTFHGASASNLFQVLQTASAVNFMTVTGGTAGNYPAFASAGSDTNIGFFFTTKGTGNIQFLTNAGAQIAFRIDHTASAVNYVFVAPSVTGATPTISAGGTDTNIDLHLVPQGTGKLKATSHVANAAVATVLGSVGPTGSSTTVQEWLVVKNSAGTSRFIPCF